MSTVKVMAVSSGNIIEVDEVHWMNVLKNQKGFVHIDDVEEPAIKPKILQVVPAPKRPPGRPKKQKEEGDSD